MIEHLKRSALIAVFASLLIYADLPTRTPFPGLARVKIAIRTESGKPTGVRLRVTNAAGDYFAPLGHLPQPEPTRRTAGDLILGDGAETPLEVHALVYDGAEIDRYVARLSATLDRPSELVVSDKRPLLVDRYLTDAVEVDVDCLADGRDTYVCGIMEHIEEAGIHSGDSACSLPPYSLNAATLAELDRQTRELALALKVVGLMNVQFAIKDGDVYVLEVNPRASRTVPFVAKVIGKPIAAIGQVRTIARPTATAAATNHSPRVDRCSTTFDDGALGDRGMLGTGILAYPRNHWRPGSLAEQNGPHGFGLARGPSARHAARAAARPV
jgi:hypothetical protein